MAYDVVLADPPWNYRNVKTGGSMKSGSAAKYETLTTQQLAGMANEIHRITHPGSVLFLWATCPMKPEALALMAAWGFCVAPKTKILMADLSWIDAADIRQGDALLAFQDEAPRRKLQWSKVVNTGLEDADCWEIVLEDGTELVCTGQHKWLAKTSHRGPEAITRWISTEQLAVSLNHHNRRYPLRLTRVVPAVQPVTDYDSGWLAGAFDGEGSISMGPPRITFAQRDNPMLQRTERVLRSRGFGFSRYNYASRSTQMVYLNGGYDEVLRFLMETRPPRLLEKFLNSPGVEKTTLWNRDHVEIKRVRPIGRHQIVTLQTTSGTYVADGFGAHNTYKTTIYWRKVMSLGMGYWFRGQVEELLVGARPKAKAFRCQRANIIQSKVRGHSRKPEESYELIEAATPGMTRAELFATIKRSGWDAWGLEVESDFELKVPQPLST